MGICFELKGCGVGEGNTKIGVDYQNWDVQDVDFPFSWFTEPSQQTLTRDRMIVPTGNHLFDSNVCCPTGKPRYTELVHVIIHIYDVFIHHGI